LPVTSGGGVGAAAGQGGERRDGAGGGEQGQGAASRDHRRSFGSWAGAASAGTGPGGGHRRKLSEGRGGCARSERSARALPARWTGEPALSRFRFSCAVTLSLPPRAAQEGVSDGDGAGPPVKCRNGPEIDSPSGTGFAS